MPVVTPANRLSAEDLLHMADNNSLEFVNGKIVDKHVSFLSSKVASWISGVFVEFVKTHPVASVCGSDMGFQCFQMIVDTPDLMRKPDVSVIRIERIKAMKDPDPGYLPIHPDLAVEVVSKNDTFRDVKDKLRAYRFAGFPLVWVVDPVDQTVAIHPLSGKAYVLSREDEIDAPNALPGFSCKVSELFPPL